MNFIKQLAVITAAITIGISLLGAIPALAAAPTITGVVISPNPAYTDSPLVATPQGWYDEDGDPANYQWQWKKYNTISSTWDDLGVTANTLGISNFAKGDQIKVICTPDDGNGIGISAESIITIMNSVPSITSVGISPNPADTNTPLVATPQGWYDEDGDPANYQWQWKKYNTISSTWDDLGVTGNTLVSSNFILNDQIKVICTPDDGTDSGEPVTATVIISVLNYDAGIDVKPGSEENPVNLKSKGVIPVVIYTTEGFDVTTINIETVILGPNEALVTHYSYEDIDDDGDIDLILHFRTQDTGITESDTEVTFTGETDSGTTFTGTNTIKIVPSKANRLAQGNESAPGQNRESGESATGKAKGKVNAPGQIKEPGTSATGKGLL